MICVIKSLKLCDKILKIATPDLVVGASLTLSVAFQGVTQTLVSHEVYRADKLNEL